MQPRKYRRWTTKLRKYVVKQCLAGIISVSGIARNRNISRRSIYMLLDRYKKNGINNLDPMLRGRKRDNINPAFELKVVQLFCIFPRGCHKMWLLFKNSGFGVSERQIQLIYRKNNFKMNRRKRPSQIKFVKYEWPKPNMLWHTDWTTCPFTGKQLIAFIDDHSRFIVHAEYFTNATTENTILAFANAIAKYGTPENILTDNGVQFTPSRTEKGPFTDWCEKRGIKHILGRVHHPQTNGKIERWFGTYKMEFQPERWTLDEFVSLYNTYRLHQGIGYKTPIERYCAINSV